MVMVIVFGKIKKARDMALKRDLDRGIEIGIARMIISMRNSGLSESDIQKTVDNLKASSNRAKRL